MELNKIYNENCLVTMGNMPNDFIDLTITSPPYDNLRDYNGYSFDFENIAKELYRVTKNGGVLVWVVSDSTINGGESGTSFKQALFFKETGFILHDTMIWDKGTFTATGSLKVRYASVFEYMFVFSKGKLKKFNPIKDKKNKHFGKLFSTSTIRQKDGTTRERSNKEKPTNEYGQRHNIWQINTSKPIGNHPATFPEKLANDHIVSWSNESDLVYDCFMGSGTTAKMCILNNRNWIGSEISSDYCDIANKRIESIKSINTLF
jgi:site-specific DNA-methyltransferase (adenine-specific)